MYFYCYLYRFLVVFAKFWTIYVIFVVHFHRDFIFQWYWYSLEQKTVLVMGYINDSITDKILSFLCNFDFPNEKIVGTILFQVQLNKLKTIYDNDLLMGGQKKVNFCPLCCTQKKITFNFKERNIRVNKSNQVEKSRSWCIRGLCVLILLLRFDS